jgi:VWFA-related protein
MTQSIYTKKGFPGFMHTSRFLIFLLILSCVAFPTASQDYQVTVSAVHVWVKAVDSSGQPVTGLTLEDFEIYEDDKKVTISCFEEQVIAGSETPVQTARPVQAVSKKFVLYLDLYNTSRREWLAVRSHLTEFLNSLSTGGHEVMLAALLPTRRLGIISPFTKDLNRIRILVGKAQAGADREIEIRRNTDEINRAIGSAEGGGGRGAVALIDRVRDGYRIAQTYAQQEQEISEYTLQAVEKFAEHMASMNLGDDPVVVYVSGGFSVDPGRQYYDIVSDLASGATNTEEFAELSKVQEANLDMRREIRKTLGKLNKLNVTFYTIDTGGLGGAAAYQDSLVEIANETGGTAFYNSQNFNIGFKQVITDLNHQYLLCFTPPVHSRAGEYHRIKVVAKRPGIELRHRKGYTD